MNRLLTFMLIGAFGFLAACNTIGGAGQDISQAGQGLSETAQDVENDL